MRYLAFGFISVYYLSMLGDLIKSGNDTLLLSMLFIVPTGVWYILLFIESLVKEIIKTQMH